MRNISSDTLEKCQENVNFYSRYSKCKQLCVHVYSNTNFIKLFVDSCSLLLLEREEPHMKRKVLRLTESFSEIKGANMMLTESTSKELFEDPLKSMEQSKRWKIKSAYGDIGLTYRDDEAIAYVASRMPAVYSACYRVLCEVKRIGISKL